MIDTAVKVDPINLDTLFAFIAMVASILSVWTVYRMRRKARRASNLTAAYDIWTRAHGLAANPKMREDSASKRIVIEQMTNSLEFIATLTNSKELERQVVLDLFDESIYSHWKLLDHKTKSGLVQIQKFLESWDAERKKEVKAKVDARLNPLA